VGYCSLTRCRERMKALMFFGGVLLIALDLMSPLDRLADEYLFSAHIAQHFVLALIVPPLLLRGLPKRLIEMALRRPLIRCSLSGGLERRIGHPPVSWLLGVGAMLLWHIPALFNAALASDGLHIFQHLSFLTAGTIYWWPIIVGSEISVSGSIAYLFTACLSCSLLGAILTFTPPGLYPAYLHPPDSLGILPLLRDQWGLDPARDQQLGGLMMWVPGCFVYLSAILWMLGRWYGTPEHAAGEQPELEILQS
jgi:putative membrane protein